MSAFNDQQPLPHAACAQPQSASRPNSKYVAPPPPAVIQSKGGNWTETFNLKGGLKIKRSPEYVTIIDGGLNINSKVIKNTGSFNGKQVNIHVSVDMTRDEFVAALRRDGSL